MRGWKIKGRLRSKRSLPYGCLQLSEFTLWMCRGLAVWPSVPTTAHSKATEVWFTVSKNLGRTVSLGLCRMKARGLEIVRTKQSFARFRLYFIWHRGILVLYLEWFSRNRISDMSTNIQFLTDSKGRKKSALVPIKQWEEVIALNQQLSRKLEVLTGIASGLHEVQSAKKAGIQLQSLSDFLTVC